MSEIVYGRHAVFHLLSAGRRKALRLYLSKETEKSDEPLVDLARSKGVPVAVQESPFFSKKAGPSALHQGFLAEVESYPFVPVEELFATDLLLILDEIQDPQNLGALCRSAYLFGVGGVVMPTDRSASIGPGACHASVGTVEYLQMAQVSNIANLLIKLKKNNFWVYGADPKGGKELMEESFPQKVVFVIGNEERGLRRLVRERCDLLLSIPMKGSQVGSFNASVSGGIFLYEIIRQRRAEIPKKTRGNS